jgi:DNA invertase Pin-like site-specific DNA recombinase
MAMSKKVINRSAAAIGYVRVSTEEQAESGLGLSRQRSVIAAEAQSKGWELAQVIADKGLSAKDIKNRPGLVKCLEMLEAGEASVLIVHKLDRLARSVGDFANIVRLAEKQGWAIFVSDLAIDMTTPTGGLMANISASVAEWERKIISQRTKDALAVKKSQGIKLGKPRQVPAEVADRIRSQRSAGLTLQAIADGLNGESITTPSGGSWSPALVRKITLQVPVAA